MVTKPPLPGGRAKVYVGFQSTKNEDVLMLSATVMRRLEALGTISKRDKRINGLFRLLEDRVLWHEAYANIYANKGAITPGDDEVTLEGFSEERVTAIIARLKNGTYRFQPTRRVYISKKTGKKRPLGISSGDDKLVQEAVRIILERIYEPIFEETSHGFRPGHSPHTALTQIGDQWNGIKWLVDMDIRDYFTTINHELLMGFLAKKIEDKRFLSLIQAMLDAGYLEEWSYYATYSGVPQGSIVSPVLANVYLHELDLFMKTLKEQFNQGKRRKSNDQYRRYSQKIARLRKQWDTLKGKEENHQKLQEIQQAVRQVNSRLYPASKGSPLGMRFRSLSTCRTACWIS